MCILPFEMRTYEKEIEHIEKITLNYFILFYSNRVKSIKLPKIT